ncbi:MAG: FtsQ-type POTRA domain-containing protein [Acidimicrobiia bacterium]|nr:FtsQ-type POTRA domain-containing protein [Acidimicrobiia bacterium]
MEPRIAMRRTNVRFRRRRRIWISVGLLALLVAAGYAFTQSPLLDVDEIQVIGAQRTGAHNVIEVAGIELGTPLLGLDLAGARRAIAALPWVDQVRSNRTWGGEITFDVSERTAVAQVWVNQKWALVDIAGRVLEVVPSRQRLPVVLVGAVAEPGGWLSSVVVPLLEVSEALMPIAGRGIDSIAWQNDQVMVNLVGDQQVYWGGRENAEAKAVALATFLDKVNSNCYDKIDLSVPAFPVLTSNRDCL